tara:strand:+ start:974 stop:1216 length:243 start_codon:yes stop_codon:yes gene_type:complete
MPDKIYVGHGVEKFNGEMVNISVNLSKLTSEGKDHIFEYEGEKFIKLNVSKKREEQFGKSHSVSIDTFKPGRKEDDDLPF